MAPIPGLALTPPPFSTRAQFQALGRSAALAVVGLSVWLALACSASSQAGAARATFPVEAPAWTRGASTSLDPVHAVRPAAKAFPASATASCALDTD